MTTKVTPTGAFLRDLKRLGKGARQDDAIAAIECSSKTHTPPV